MPLPTFPLFPASSVNSTNNTVGNGSTATTAPTFTPVASPPAPAPAPTPIPTRPLVHSVTFQYRVPILFVNGLLFAQPQSAYANWQGPTNSSLWWQTGDNNWSNGPIYFNAAATAKDPGILYLLIAQPNNFPAAPQGSIIGHMYIIPIGQPRIGENSVTFYTGE
jgi:hypothetical protein